MLSVRPVLKANRSRVPSKARLRYLHLDLWNCYTWICLDLSLQQVLVVSTMGMSSWMTFPGTLEYTFSDLRMKPFRILSSLAKLYRKRRMLRLVRFEVIMAKNLKIQSLNLFVKTMVSLISSQHQEHLNRMVLLRGRTEHSLKWQEVCCVKMNYSNTFGLK